MDFLGNLGIDLKLLVAQIINFVILLFVLNKLVYKPVLRRIENAKKDISISNNSEVISVETDQKFSKEDVSNKKKNVCALNNKDIYKDSNEIEEARKIAKEIINEAEQIAKEIKKRAIEETEKEKKAVIAQLKSRLKE